MGLVKRVISEAAETSMRAIPLIGSRLLEIKGEMVYQRIKEDIELNCHLNHSAVVIDTKVDQWKTAKNLVYAGRMCKEMQHPSYCYVKELENNYVPGEELVFFEKYNSE